LAIVLLPFAIQTAHAFEKHEHSASNIYITFNEKYELESECSFYHYKLNNNFVDFSGNYSIAEIQFISDKIINSEVEISSLKLHSKSSRAPPFLLF